MSYNYSEFERRSLRHLYITGQQSKFDKLDDETFKTTLTRYVHTLQNTVAFAKLRTNDIAVKHAFDDLVHKLRLHPNDKIGLQNAVRLVLTNLYQFK